MPKKRKGKRKKKRRKHDEMIVRGKSAGGDLILDLQHFLVQYEKYHGKKHPFHDLTEEERKTTIDCLILLKQTGKMPDIGKEPEEFEKVVDSMVKAAPTKAPPEATPSADHIPGIKELREKAKVILESNPQLAQQLQDDLDGPTPQSRRKATINNYLTTMDTLLRASRGEGQVRKDRYPHHKRGDFGEGDEHTKQLARKAWSDMREARIFEIPQVLAATLYHQVDLHLCDLAGVEWTHPEAYADIPDEEVQRYTSIAIHHRKYQRLPEKMPFEKMYLEISPGITLNDTQKDLWGVKEKSERSILYGFLITPTSVTTLISVGKYFSPQFEMVNNDWVRSMTSTPWWVSWMIEWINDHQTVIAEGTNVGYRQAFKREAKKKSIKKPIPPPYYTVTMHDRLIEEDDWIKQLRMASRPSPVKQKCQHQYDVRGHWCVRVMRGPLPLEPKLEKKLRQDKRRKIFTNSYPDAETAAKLAKRGVAAKRVDEWLAVLVYWRDDHKRGPEDGPYIPSIRRSARKPKEAA